MLYQAGWRVTQGILACHCTMPMGCLHTCAAYCSGHFTAGDVGGMTLLTFLPTCFIPNALNFHDRATCALREHRHTKSEREIQ